MKDAPAPLLTDSAQNAAEFAIEEQKHITRIEFELIKKGKTVIQEEELLGFEDLDFIVEVTPDIKEVYLDILAGAIKKERESFRAYLNLYSMANTPETRETLEALIEEELRHKMLLEIKYNYASGLK